MTNVNSDNSSSGSFPYRGLAMVLITVAVLFGLWGLYALTQGGGDSAQNAAGSSEQQTAQQADPAGQATGSAAAAQPATDASAQPSESASAASSASAADQPADSAAATASATPATGERSAAPQYGQPLPKDSSLSDTVNVYNNSTVQGLAADVSQQLRGDGIKVGVESGNIPESDMILAETTVFYDPEIDGAEEKARELADRFGGVARENVDTLPEEATKGGALTLVLTGQGI